MKRTIVLALFFIFVVYSSSAVGNESLSDNDTLLKVMFNYANSGNLSALEAMKEDVNRQGNKKLDLAYSLALYIASPKNYERQYVEAFPVNYESIMYYLYEQIELKRLTPKFLFSIESIGSIAKKGNTKAIEKVFRGYIHSDGVVSEAFCDCISGLFIEQFQKSVSVLSRIEKGDREKDYLCVLKLSLEEFAQLKKSVEKLTPSASKKEKSVIQEIMKIKK